jgi:hypothetical protein
MRITHPEKFDTRVVSKFAFLPIRIMNQTIWLERVKIKQMYEGQFGWINIEFLDEIPR